jgi:glycosyltransferase involved in cell wall biosynthesis
MLSVHRRIGTYRDRVSRYIALNEFCRDKFVQGGLPAEKILIKPNFVKKPSIDCHSTRTSEILFVGRLSHEKGIETLANAAKRQPAIRINVAGTGPLGEMLDGIPNIRRLGFLSPSAILEEMRRALCLVMPSIWYENFPRTLVEAYAMGLPVVASQLGALGELVVDGETGVLFEPGNDEDLAAKLAWAVNNKGEMETRGRAAHGIYEELYSPDANYRILLNIYREAADAS